MNGCGLSIMFLPEALGPEDVGRGDPAAMIQLQVLLHRPHVELRILIIELTVELWGRSAHDPLPLLERTEDQPAAGGGLVPADQLVAILEGSAGKPRAQVTAVGPYRVQPSSDQQGMGVA